MWSAWGGFVDGLIFVLVGVVVMVVGVWVGLASVWVGLVGVVGGYALIAALQQLSPPLPPLGSRLINSAS